MKKASCTIIWDSRTKQLYYMAINHNNTIIPLVRYNQDMLEKPYCYNTIQELYKSILNIVKQNGYYLSKYKEFGAAWYDIQWIDRKNPCKIEKYGYIEKGIEK